MTLIYAFVFKVCPSTRTCIFKSLFRWFLGGICFIESFMFFIFDTKGYFESNRPHIKPFLIDFFQRVHEIIFLTLCCLFVFSYYYVSFVIAWRDSDRKYLLNISWWRELKNVHYWLQQKKLADQKQVCWRPNH